MTERLTHTHTHTCLSVYLSISSLSLGLDSICGIFGCRKAFNSNELNVSIFFILSVLFLIFSSIVFVLCLNNNNNITCIITCYNNLMDLIGLPSYFFIF